MKSIISRIKIFTSPLGRFFSFAKVLRTLRLRQKKSSKSIFIFLIFDTFIQNEKYLFIILPSFDICEYLRKNLIFSQYSLRFSKCLSSFEDYFFTSLSLCLLFSFQGAVLRHVKDALSGEHSKPNNRKILILCIPKLCFGCLIPFSLERR